MNNNLRTISQIIEPQIVIEGAGVKLRRSIAPKVSNALRPFPALRPLRLQRSHRRTDPRLPVPSTSRHRDGHLYARRLHAHRDSLGNAGLIGPGDVQWMSSGRGILHEEMPRRGPGGAIYGFQLWVNLPAHLKMSEPRYQEVTAATIPTYEKDGVKIRVVAGTVDTVSGPVTDIAASPLYMDVELAPDLEWQFPIPSGHTLITYVFEGEGVFSGETVNAVKMVKFNDGDHIP